MNKKIKKIEEEGYYIETRKNHFKSIRVFNDLGQCIQMTEYQYHSGGSRDKIEHESIYDKRNNLLNKRRFNLFFSETDDYDNQYDKNGNLKRYDRVRTIERNIGNGDKKLSRGEFRYDDEGILIKKTVYDNINSDEKIDSIYKEITEIKYDNLGELSEKFISTLNKNPSSNYFKYTEERFRFYYNESGQKIEEINLYNKYEEDGDLIHSRKIIKTKKEEFYYDTNNKIEGKTLNSFDKNDNLIRKEYFDIAFSESEPTSISNFTYTFTD
jgi:hypothetical protein